MSIPLTSTRYLLTTDDLIAGWDQRSWIESADDRQTPDTSANSFDELQAAAVSGGPGSDAEKVRDQIIAVLSADARSAEQWLEAFALGIYKLPLNPCDGVAADLIRAWMKHQAKTRHDLYKGEMQITMERSLITRATYIRNEMTRLSSARADAGSNLNESIAAFGGDDRRDPGDPGPFSNSGMFSGFRQVR